MLKFLAQSVITPSKFFCKKDQLLCNFRFPYIWPPLVKSGKICTKTTYNCYSQLYVVLVLVFFSGISKSFWIFFPEFVKLFIMLSGKSLSYWFYNGQKTYENMNLLLNLFKRTLLCFFFRHTRRSFRPPSPLEREWKDSGSSEKEATEIREYHACCRGELSDRGWIFSFISGDEWWGQPG